MSKPGLERYVFFQCTMFLVIFQDVNRGFVPAPGLDLRFMVVAMAGALLAVRYLELFLTLRLPRFAGPVAALACWAAYCAVTYAAQPLSPAGFFLRRYFQLGYLVLVSAFVLTYADFVRAGIRTIIVSFAAALGFFLIGQALEASSVGLNAFTWYPYATSAAPTVTWLPGGIRRLSSFAFDPNVAAIYLGVGYVVFRDLGKRTGRSDARALGAACLAGLLLTFSRGALLGLAAFMGLRAFRRLKRPDRWLVVEVLALMALLAAAAVSAFGAIGPLDMSNAIRLDFWRRAFKLLVSHPLFGIGLSNIGEVFSSTGLWWAAVHNAYLHVAVETGLIGTAAYLAAIGSGLFAARALLRSSGSSALLDSMVYVCVVIFFISEQFDPTLFIMGAVALSLRGDDGKSPPYPEL